MAEESTINDPRSECRAGGEMDTDAGYDQTLEEKDIRRNMKSLVLLETTFWTGAADIQLALQPLLVFLGATNTMIGYVNGATFMGLIGVLLSPWITKRFPYKKWYLFVGNVPYLTALAVMGFLAVYSDHLGFSRQTLLHWVFGLYLTHWFFGGFVTLPCTEYIAACIPMSHRGRLTGYAYGAAGGLAIGAAYVGKLILQSMSKPAAFGYVLLLGWFLQQAGYTASLFARERRTPVEHSPQPYTREMFQALWQDKPYVKLLVLYCLYTTFFYTTTFNFVNVYGFRQLHMAYATMALMIIVGNVSKMLTSAHLGLFIDRMTPKRVLPYIFFLAAAAWIAPVIIKGIWGVYTSVALSTVCVTGLITAQTALICGLPKPEHRAGHFTIQVITMYVALTAGPILLGHMCDWLPYRMVFTLMAIISLLFFPLAKVLLKDLPDDVKEYC